MPKYDRIGLGYNQTRKADPYLKARMVHHLALRPDGQYLDIGCGTGNYTRALRQKGGSWVGVEPSSLMLAHAQKASTHIIWMQGVAEALPLSNQCMDGALASLTLHHWRDLPQAFGEISRILKPGGRIVIFTSTPAQMQGYWLNHYFPKMLHASMVLMPTFETVALAMQRQGLGILATETYEVRPDLQDQFLYVGKAQPHLYLDPQVRQGISSFSDLAHAEEVEHGLAQLQRDLASGEIQALIDRYSHPGGDYLFIIGKKK